MRDYLELLVDTCAFAFSLACALIVFGATIALAIAAICAVVRMFGGAQ